MPESAITAALTASLSRAEALRRAARMLEKRGIAEARTDARHLGLHALELTPTDLALRGAEPVGPAGAAALAQAVLRRLAGEPVARILGEWEFFGLTFALTPDTLVPRPDTETLVETALLLAGEPVGASRLLDLGTGSGCILTALLTALPGSVGIGTDVSQGALATARSNALRNGVSDRALFLCGNWCAPLVGPFDLILSNPPYIASEAIPGLAVEVRRHDPLAALDGGADGLDAYRAILSEIAERPGLLAPGGALVLEIGHDQARAVMQLGLETGFSDRRLTRDLAGRDRVVVLRRHASATVSRHLAG